MFYAPSVYQHNSDAWMPIGNSKLYNLTISGLYTTINTRHKLNKNDDRGELYRMFDYMWASIHHSTGGFHLVENIFCRSFHCLNKLCVHSLLTFALLFRHMRRGTISCCWVIIVICLVIKSRRNMSAWMNETSKRSDVA